MPEKKDSSKDISEDISIEEAFGRLAEISEALESPDISLKDSLKLYKEGVGLISRCKENLEGVEKEIQILNEV